MFTIKLTLEETNLIITALSKLPYEDVALLINSIREQAVTQLNSPQSPPPPPSDECCSVEKDN